MYITIGIADQKFGLAELRLNILAMLGQFGFWCSNLSTVKNRKFLHKIENFYIFRLKFFKKKKLVFYPALISQFLLKIVNWFDWLVLILISQKWENNNIFFNLCFFKLVSVCFQKEIFQGSAEVDPSMYKMLSKSAVISSGFFA